ncbi:MAG: NUDIX hydrolase, partial [Syntrophales bacterium]|nr:NUDIX hydrolase [Syntrophales bacterium]
TLPMTTPVYTCRVFTVYEDDVTLPNGRKTRQSWIDHRPCIAVVPVDNDGNIVLIRQYRHAATQMLIEIPAGSMDKDGESAEACAQRELAEEIGFRAGRMEKLFEGYLIPGYGNEYMYFFLARDLATDPLPPDADEVIETFTVRPQEARAMIADGTIRDTKTALGIILALERLAT